MQLILKYTAKKLRCRMLVAFIALLLGFASALMAQIGFLLIPLTASLLTLLLFLEQGRVKAFSIITVICFVLADALFNGIYSVVSLCAISVSILVYVVLSRSMLTKGDCAVAVTVLTSLFLGLAMLMYAFGEIGSFDFTGAENYYAQVMDQMRESFIGGVSKAVDNLQDPEMSQILTREYLSSMMDSYFLSFISVIAVIAFTLTGLYFKLFWFIFKKCLDNPMALARRRFYLSPSYAYAYIVAYFISGLANTIELFSVVVMNFTNAFMYIFAYLGFVFLFALLERRIGNRLASAAIIIFIALMFYSFAVTILSFIGVFSMIALDREKRRREHNANKK